MSFRRDYRDALAQFPTGVAVVSVMDNAMALGLTVSSFLSVSLEPKLVLWSIDHCSNRYELFKREKSYAISVLAGDQREAARICAIDAELGKNGVEWERGQTGVPVLKQAIARFECSQYAVHPAGDHDIILGEVLHFDQPQNGAALVFHQSMFNQTDKPEA